MGCPTYGRLKASMGLKFNHPIGVSPFVEPLSLRAVAPGALRAPTFLLKKLAADRKAKEA